MSDRAPSPTPSDQGLAIVLGGGGARAAYQVGLLRCLGRRMPDLRFDVITGVSAGAINAIYLAAHPGDLLQAADGLTKLWRNLDIEDVFRVDSPSLGRVVLGWALRLISGGGRMRPTVRGLVDTSPLAALLRRALDTDDEVTGIADNLELGRLRSVALTTLDYSTGRTITWVQGRDIHNWERPNRRSARTRMTVDHVMASASLPLLFPAVRLGRDWHGDGGVRLTAPLSPALHLGANRAIAISTRYGRSAEEADRPSISGYPPPAQILGHLLNAVFLDVLDQDVARLETINDLIRHLPPGACPGQRPIDILALRPSQDLGQMAGDYEPRLPRVFRFLTRGLGTRETTAPDLLSMLMFHPDYLRRLIEIGEADAEARFEEIARVVAGPATVDRRPTRS